MVVFFPSGKQAKHEENLQEQRVNGSVVEEIFLLLSWILQYLSLGSICSMEFFPFVRTVVNWGLCAVQDCWAGVCPGMRTASRAVIS